MQSLLLLIIKVLQEIKNEIFWYFLTVKQGRDDVHGRMGSRDDDDVDDEDIPIEMSPVEKQIETIKQTEDLINSSAAKRVSFRLILMFLIVRLFMTF